MRNGPEGFHLVAVKGDEVIRGTMRELADLFACSNTKIMSAIETGKKVMGYRIYEEYYIVLRLIDHRKKEVVAEARTMAELCRLTGIERWEMNNIDKWGTPMYRIDREKVYKWKI